jgi:hypothetical protein
MMKTIYDLATEAGILKDVQRVALKRAAMDDRMYSDDGQW